MDFRLNSPTPSLTPSVGSPSPAIPVQPDHFYRTDDSNASPSSPRWLDGTTWYDPEDDRLASRGIPVFKPTMEEFRDFEAYMNRVECWGKYSGIIKVIPPKEWRDALPPIQDQLSSVQIKTPIEQHMLGQTGLFRQQNVEKSKTMSVREWTELCNLPDYRAPSIEEVGLHARALTVPTKTRKTRKSKLAIKADPDNMTTQVRIKEEPVDDGLVMHPPHSVSPVASGEEDIKPKPKIGKKQSQKLSDAEKLEKDSAFLESFDPNVDWLPFSTKPEDYTPEFCAKLERQYWRNMGLGKAPWYGADTQGSLYTDETTEWNVAHLESELSRLLPSNNKGLPGVNTPYLYWGMWRATFAWHVEDMDLFSINYIHFGAPKHWYAIPQGRASALEQTMRSYFPKDTSLCPQFLRHKSFLASPTLLAKSSCKPNTLVQHAGEFVITYPRGYHAGFNLGLNCAESVNFALKSWIEIGKVAKACKCVSDSVVIDVNQLIADREMEREMEREMAKNPKSTKPRSPPKASMAQSRTRRSSVQSSAIRVKREEVYVLVPPLTKANSKRKAASAPDDAPAAKKSRKKKASTITLPSGSSSTSQDKKPSHKISIKLKLGPKPEPEVFPCCLCVSLSNAGLLRVHDPPYGRKEALEACSRPTVWMAHETCANIVPETWVDEVEKVTGEREKVVFGVDGIVKDRWHLKCSLCTRNQPKAHGAPIQCTRGKCLKAFHVSCAQNGTDNNIVFETIREVEKEVVLLDSTNSDAISPPSHMQVDERSSSDAFIGESGNDAMGTVNDSRVLKIIKKLEVQVLCAQHNPAVASARKALKQDRIKADLLSLPPMSRIKLRVTAGVFEVSLVRVIEESGSVEVLWDRGLKKEFKWSSVVFGKTEGPVLQKPSEPAPDSEQLVNGGASLNAHPAFSVPSTQGAYQPSTGQVPSKFSVPLSSVSQTNGTLMLYPYAAYRPYQYGTYAAHNQVTQTASSASPSTTHSSGARAISSAAFSQLAVNSYRPSQSSYLWHQSTAYNTVVQPNTPTSQPPSSHPNLNQTSTSSQSQTPVPYSPPSNNIASASTNTSPPPLPAQSLSVNDIAHAAGDSQPSAQGSGLNHPGTSSVLLPHPSQHLTENLGQTPFLDFEALKALPPEQLAHLVQHNSAFRTLLLGPTPTS